MKEVEGYEIIYLLGAGRSGTTFLATLLNINENITTLGEMHFFLEFILEDKKCSCSKHVSDCDFWKNIIFEIKSKWSTNDLYYYKEKSEKIERHGNILNTLFFKKQREYLDFNKNIFKIIYKNKPNTFYLDSAKYISRGINVLEISSKNKAIYMVRDVRGLINSFSKKVQTSRSPLSTILYYIIINLLGEITYRYKKKQILKIKYEDLVAKPKKTITKIESFLDIDLTGIKKSIENSKEIEIPHIIGGNRLKNNKTIKLKKDLEWKSNLSRFKQIIYYLFCLPLMIVNKYKI